MKYAVILFFLLIFIKVHAQKVEVMDFNAFEPELQYENDTLYMVHFWATWCVPCIKEMPLILEETSKIRQHKFKLVLVSFDFERDINTKLSAFIEKNHIEQDIIVLDDPDFNSWINKIDPTWSGGIPATLFYRNKSKWFYEGAFEENELTETIKTILKTQ